MKNSNKKNLLAMAIAVLFLLILVIGAAYAYFSAGIINNFGTHTITADLEESGSVALSGTNSSFYFSLTLNELKESNASTYYASSYGSTQTPTVATIATANVTPSTVTSYYECTFSLNITHSGTNDMYDRFNSKTGNTYNYANRSKDQIILTINGTNYDFYDGIPSTITGLTFTTSAGNPAKITAGLRFINSEIDQSYLLNTDVSFTISVVANSLSCEAKETGVKTILASGAYTLYNSEAGSDVGTFYKYNGNANGARNVLYADKCWQIIRTTRNNSVKMIYNGEPLYDSATDKYTCINGRPGGVTQTGSRTTLYMGASSSYNYYYGSGYEYSAEKGGYILTDEEGPYNWYNRCTSSSNCDLIGKYTCSKTTANSVCSGTIYKLDGWNSRYYPYVYRYTIGAYDNIGNSYFNSASNSMAYVGYKYNTVYTAVDNYLDVNNYAPAPVDDGSPESFTDYLYIGDLGPEDTSYPGTWTIVNLTEVDESLWQSNYSNYVGKYYCVGGSGYTCEARLITEAESDYLYYSAPYKFASSYDSVNQKLSGTVKTYWYSCYYDEEQQWDVCTNIPEGLNYTCNNASGVCSSPYYLTSDSYSSYSYNAIQIPDNKTPKMMVDEMLNNSNVNNTNSTIKGVIDTWYGNNILNSYDDNNNLLSDYLDTEEIFCNNRGLQQSGSIFSPTFAYNYIGCTDKDGTERVIDEFSVSKGNMALTYPIGLPSIGEISLLNSSARTASATYWTMSPYQYDGYYAYVGYITTNGSWYANALYNTAGVRPVLSLKKEVVFKEGTGVPADPWIATLE